MPTTEKNKTEMDLSKKHGMIAIMLGVLSLIIPILAPFALWQGIKANKFADSKWGFIGYIMGNISMAIFTIYASAFVYGFIHWGR